MTARTRVLVLAAVWVTAVVAVSAAAATTNATPAPWKIGAQLDLTGAANFAGIGGQQGLELAVAQINARGGINGRKIKIYVADSATTPDGGVLAARKLIQENDVDAVISCASSGATMAATAVARDAKIPYLVSCAGDSRVQNPWSKYIFQGAVVTLPQVAQHATDFIQNYFKGKKVSIVWTATLAIGKSGSDALAAELTRKGIKVVSNQNYVDTDTDFTSQIQAIKAADPDVIYTIAYPTPASRFMTQLRNAGVKTPVVGDTSQAVPDLPKLGGQAVEGMYTMWAGASQFIGDNTGAMRMYLAAFKKRYPNVPSTYPNFLGTWTYADTFVLADALRRANSTDADKIVAALEGTRGFIAGKGKIFGYAYPIGLARTFTKFNHNGTRKEALVMIKNGRFVPVDLKKPRAS
jgi:branched-chain amino acid transport system substrate-binding protein